jgi:pSer/pThr/pTyr-binding forkhead associated (FHA) protein
MRVNLTVAVRGEMEGQRIPITLADFLIGRDPHCHLCPDSTLVRARHCVLQTRDNGVFVQNLDSTAATFVNDREITGGIQLVDGDRLRVGPLVFDLSIETGPPRPKTVSMMLDERARGTQNGDKRKDTGKGPLVREDPLARTVVKGPQSASYYLILANGENRGMPIPICVDLFMIGNDKICQLQPRLPDIGDRHCALVTRNGKVFVRDLNSGYPTMLKGELITPGEEWPGHAGDRIAVGSLELMLQYREKPLWGRDLEEWGAKCLDVSSERDLFDEDADEFHKATTASEAAARMIDKLQAQRGHVMGRLRIGRQAGVCIVRLNDRHLIDEGEIAMIKKELCDNLSRNNLRVLLDCKNVVRLSTGAVKMLDEFRGWLGPWGSTLAMCRIRADLLQMMRTMGLGLAQVPVFPDKQSAFDARW